MKNNLLKSALLQKGLPLLANVLTGGTAKPAFELVKSILSLKVNDDDGFLEQLTQKPDLIDKLREFEINQEIELQKLALQSTRLEIEESKAYLLDKQSARLRETQLAQATGQRDWLMLSLAIVVVIGFFSLISIMILGDNAQKVTNNGPVNQLFGALVAGFSMVLSYFFGSSKSSADKTKTIANQRI
ncbi:hypothetical protein [Saccharicrinis fermentans]|uniref:Uncharacterized protein n=1 Tax=Saccharicrinis fermentans DSM 9555 = JCM 21142 TaxID=869213 RepID=W7YED8_9BACT|nr:hypothetical protein [Saccharicrinis fermentans]GAF05838.1 hypothetical protein JCM21142_114592 [Saccharicrinis fermentans DSM 9555 = JCM 21142]